MLVEASPLKDLFNANVCWLVLIYDTLFQTKIPSVTSSVNHCLMQVTKVLPVKRSNYPQNVALSRWNYAAISQENNSPLTLYIEFHNFYFFLDINSPVDNHKLHNHLSPNMPVEGRCIFMKSENFVKFVYSSIRQLYCCDIKILAQCHLRGRHTRN